MQEHNIMRDAASHTLRFRTRSSLPISEMLFISYLNYQVNTLKEISAKLSYLSKIIMASASMMALTSKHKAICRHNNDIYSIKHIPTGSALQGLICKWHVWNPIK